MRCAVKSLALSARKSRKTGRVELAFDRQTSHITNAMLIVAHGCQHGPQPTNLGGMVAVNSDAPESNTNSLLVAQSISDDACSKETVSPFVVLTSH